MVGRSLRATLFTFHTVTLSVVKGKTEFINMCCVSCLLFSFEIPIHLQDQFPIGPTLIAGRIHYQKHTQSPFKILPLVKDASNLKPEVLVEIL